MFMQFYIFMNIARHRSLWIFGYFAFLLVQNDDWHLVNIYLGRKILPKKRTNIIIRSLRIYGACMRVSRVVSFHLIVVEHRGVLAEGIKRKIYFSLFKKDTECTTADTNYAYNSCFVVNNRPYCQVEARGPCRRVLSLYNDLDPTNGVTANAHTAFTIHRSLSLSFSLSLSSPRGSPRSIARLQHVCVHFQWQELK